MAPQHHIPLPLSITGGIIIFILAITFALSARGRHVMSVSNMPSTTPPSAIPFSLSSPIFTEGGMIPAKYACDGDDVSPPLDIMGVPGGTESLVLIMDDPDAPRGTWTHWVAFNISATTTHINEGEEPDGTAGSNSWPKEGYGGPCPPAGVHRYIFKLYALDTKLNLAEGATKEQVEQAMQGHIVAQTQLTGLYGRDVKG